MKKVLFSSVVLFSMLYAGGCVIEPVAPVAPVTSQAAPQSSYSGSGFYIGGAASLVSAREAQVDADFFDDKAGQDRLGNLMLLGGYNFNKYFAVEGRASVTVGGEDYTKLTSFSIFAKPQYPINDKFTVYGLIGTGYVKLDDNDGSNVDISKGSFQWGLGASYNINEQWSVFADYTSLANGISGTFLRDDEADVDSINVGVTYKF